MEWLSLNWMGWQDWIGNACYLLLAISYGVSSIYWLRGLAIVALGLESIYFFFGSDTPLWVGIGWNSIFIAMNLLQLALLLHRHMRVRIDEEERLLHRGLFSELPLPDFKQLLRLGRWRNVPEGTRLAVQNQPVAEVMVIISGAARVEVDGKLVALLQPGNFVGEMSFLTKGNALADVTTVNPSRLFCIEKEKLKTLFHGSADINTAFHRIVGQDLVRKLMSASH